MIEIFQTLGVSFVLMLSGAISIGMFFYVKYAIKKHKIKFESLLEDNYRYFNDTIEKEVNEDIKALNKDIKYIYPVLDNFQDRITNLEKEVGLVKCVFKNLIDIATHNYSLKIENTSNEVQIFRFGGKFPTKKSNGLDVQFLNSVGDKDVHEVLDYIISNFGIVFSEFRIMADPQILKDLVIEYKQDRLIDKREYKNPASPFLNPLQFQESIIDIKLHTVFGHHLYIDRFSHIEFEVPAGKSIQIHLFSNNLQDTKNSGITLQSMYH